ncbi:MAG: translation initiation factor IF-1 [Candidatus Jorgensenbacteria bacterium]|nr:translation initiation factor IF-1 [Candidatus Jorgensenbacteria bacterium]
MKSDEQLRRVDGRVEEALPNMLFRVILVGGQEVLARLAGRLGRFRIRVVPGDRVVVEMTPYDERRGRIIKRL